MDDYIYQEPKAGFGPLPEGEYPFIVTDVSEPYKNPKTGNHVLPVKLAIGPEKIPVYDNPSAGVSKKGDPYDRIAQFLKAINRTPGAGKRPDVSRQNLVGSMGRVVLSVETAQAGSLVGKLVNKVKYYVWDDNSGRQIVLANDDPEPADIPF